MKIDLTITISIILALSAILSPIFVSIINNRYQLKIKKIDNNYIAKRNAFENYSKSVGKYVTYDVGKYQLEMIDALYALLPYFEISLSDIKDFVEISENKEIVIQKSSELLEKLKKQL